MTIDFLDWSIDFSILSIDFSILSIDLFNLSIDFSLFGVSGRNFPEISEMKKTPFLILYLTYNITLSDLQNLAQFAEIATNFHLSFQPPSIEISIRISMKSLEISIEILWR